METNTDPIDPLSANVTALATHLESKYAKMQTNCFLRLTPKKNFKIWVFRDLSFGSASVLTGNENDLSKNFLFKTRANVTCQTFRVVTVS